MSPKPNVVLALGPMGRPGVRSSNGSRANRLDAETKTAGELLGFVLLTSAAASPLYAVYRAQWKFSEVTLTAVFAIYAIFLLATLVVFGSVADYLGRRPVILAGLAATAAACALFLAVRGVGLLFSARALQGVAIGMATGGLGAAVGLQPFDTTRTAG
jgi:MFS family permease